jgi:hypothetical protein
MSRSAANRQGPDDADTHPADADDSQRHEFNIGDVNFIVPTVSVLSIAKPDSKNVFSDPDGHEMIMIQKTCYPLIRLNNSSG